MEPERYRVSDLLIDVPSRRVTRNGQEIPLPGLSFDLLLALVRKAPAMVSVNELMDAVWPGRVVNPETVAKRVELVREALGDDSHEPRYLALVRGHGYRLVGAVQPATAEPAPPVVAERVEPATGPPARRRRGLIAGLAIASVVLVLAYFGINSPPPEGTDPATTPSVAVLPFANLSEDAANAYFSDGISEELLVALSKLQGLRVASRTSSFAFKNKDVPLPEIARALNVDHVVEGSVRKAGDRIRIAAQLIEVESDSHLWSEVYDRQLEDIFAIQKEIAANVARALEVRLAQPIATAADVGGPRNVEAYQLYLRGRQLWMLRGEDNIRTATRLLTRAIELDPSFARAHAALAQAYVLTNLYYEVPDEQALHLAARSAARAIELDATLSEPHAAQGQIAMQQMDWIRAEAAHRRATELNGNDATAWYWLGETLKITGRTRDAIPVLLKAESLDPISPPLLQDLAEIHMRTGTYDKACSYATRASEVGSRPFSWLLLARCHEHSGDLPAAEKAEATAERLADVRRPALTPARRALHDPAERPAALAALAALEAKPLTLYPARPYWRLGEFDAAFDTMEASLSERNFNYLHMLWDPEDTKMRNHPRFHALAERSGLLAYWRHTGRWPDLCRPVADSFECD